jgi:hypothetical protein
MRIVIQHSVNRKFFDGMSWKTREEDAAEFGSVLQAERLCHANNFSDALVVLKFSGRGEDISYSVSDAPAPLRSRTDEVARGAAA